MIVRAKCVILCIMLCIAVSLCNPYKRAVDKRVEEIKHLSDSIYNWHDTAYDNSANTDSIDAIRDSVYDYIREEMVYDLIKEDLKYKANKGENPKGKNFVLFPTFRSLYLRDLLKADTLELFYKFSSHTKVFYKRQTTDPIFRFSGSSNFDIDPIGRTATMSTEIATFYVGATRLGAGFNLKSPGDTANTEIPIDEQKAVQDLSSGGGTCYATLEFPIFLIDTKGYLSLTSLGRIGLEVPKFGTNIEDFSSSGDFRLSLKGGGILIGDTKEPGIISAYIDGILATGDSAFRKSIKLDNKKIFPYVRTGVDFSYKSFFSTSVTYTWVKSRFKDDVSKFVLSFTLLPKKTPKMN